MIVIPRLKANPTPDDISLWADQLVRSLQTELNSTPVTGRDSSGKPVPYQPSDYTATRVIDAGTANLTTVANVLATLVSDLKKHGTIL